MGPPMYHLPGNVISATVGLVSYINLQPEYELSSSTGFGQFQKFGKIGVGGHHPLQPHVRKQFLYGIRVLVRGALALLTSEI